MLATTTFGDFVPDSYLAQYYRDVGDENAALLAFFARSYERLGSVGRLLDVGSGPTIYQLLSAAARCESIDVADFLPANRVAIERWLADDPAAHDWRPFVEQALAVEGLTEVGPAEVSARVGLLRDRIAWVGSCDVHADHAGLPLSRRSYDVVSVNFVLESITDDRDIWRRSLHTVCELVAPGGALVLSSLESATHWRSGPHVFPAVHLTEADILAALGDEGLAPLVVEGVTAEAPDPGDPDFAGYRGMVLVTAGRTR